MLDFVMKSSAIIGVSSIIDIFFYCFRLSSSQTQPSTQTLPRVKIVLKLFQEKKDKQTPNFFRQALENTSD